MSWQQYSLTTTIQATAMPALAPVDMSLDPLPPGIVPMLLPSSFVSVFPITSWLAFGALGSMYLRERTMLSGLDTLRTKIELMPTLLASIPHMIKRVSLFTSTAECLDRCKAVTEGAATACFFHVFVSRFNVKQYSEQTIIVNVLAHCDNIDVWKDTYPLHFEFLRRIREHVDLYWALSKAV